MNVALVTDEPTPPLLAAPITDEEELFLLEYLSNGRNGTQAYLRIKPRVKYRPAQVQASRILDRANIQARLAVLQGELRDRAMVRAEDVIQKLKAVAFADLRDVAEWDGNTLTIKPSHEITPDAAYALDEIEMADTEQGRRLKIKLQPRLQALTKLGETLALFKKVIEHDGTVRWVVELPGQMTETEWRTRYAKQLPRVEATTEEIEQ